MADSSYPANFVLFNDLTTKNLNVVVSIEGVDEIFSLVTTYKKIRYGDPDIVYGKPGLVYGGLVPVPGLKPYLSIESSLMISQKLEPEQGRGSVSTLGLVFIDVEGYFTKLCSPGQTVDELLGNKEFTVRLGYTQTSYPEDYFTVFRGYASKTRLMPTKVAIELSDSNIKRRQQLFFSQKTILTSAVDDSTLSIPVELTERFFQQVLGPDGNYDPAIKTYARIEDEIMEYGPAGLGSNTITVLSRGALGTTAVAHDIEAEVQAMVSIEDNIMDMALKFMLSGWVGNWLTGVDVRSIGETLDPTLNVIPNVFLMNVDVVDVYGLTVGDYFTLSGSGSGNNLTGRIIGFGDASELPNRLIYTDQTFTTETPATGVVAAFRSQFDTYPVECGLKMKCQNVDVQRHVDIRNNFLSQAENQMRFLISKDEAGKDFIEKQLFLPVGLYSLTRFGRVSAVITKPPIADERLTFLSNSNIIDPQNMSVERGLNMRRFYNEIQFSFDERTLDGEFGSVQVLLDSDSLNRFDQSSVMPIEARGMRTDLNASVLIDKRGNYILDRYKNAAFELNLKVNWQAGTLIEAGDVVAVKDDGTLFIANLSNGTRNLGTQLFEVIERNLDIKSGSAQLKLLSNLGYNVNDRFATISPSSIVGTGSTVASIKLTPSFGQLYGPNEYKKYSDYVGLSVVVHDLDYTYSYESKIVGFGGGDPNLMLVSPNLSGVPVAGDIVEIGDYPDNVDPSDQEAYKLIHAFIDATLTVVSGASATVFDVSPSDAVKVVVGQYILIHNDDYTIFSPEVVVESLVGNTVTVSSSLGFTPAAGQFVELVGFKDLGGAYRII